MLTIGIDPASDGSACIIRDNIVLMSLSWSRKRRQKNKQVYTIHLVDISLYGDPQTKSMQCKTGADIGAQIGAYVTLLRNDENEPFYIASEDAYVGKNSNSAIVVARFAGMIVGALHNYTRASLSVSWIKPSKWQTAILKIPFRAKREERKRRSLHYIPNMATGVDQHLDKLGQLDHITDAVGIALYAIRYTIQHNNTTTTDRE